EDVLKRIADFTEHQEDLKAKVVGALIYPMFLAVVGTLVLFGLVLFVVPRFEPIFKKLQENDDLPWLTQMLLGTSHFLLSWGGVATVVVLFGAIAAWYSWVKTDAGRLRVDGWRLRLPGAGKIYLHLAISRFTRILGTLLHNGIPILQALRIAKDSTGN